MDAKMNQTMQPSPEVKKRGHDWKRYDRKLQDLEFYYSGGPTRCVPTNHMLYLANSENVSVISRQSRGSTRSKSTGRSVASSRSGSSISSVYSSAPTKIKSLEDKLAKFKSEREKAEQQLTQTINQLQKLEQIVGERV